MDIPIGTAATDVIDVFTLPADCVILDAWAKVHDACTEALDFMLREGTNDLFNAVVQTDVAGDYDRLYTDNDQNCTKTSAASTVNLLFSGVTSATDEPRIMVCILAYVEDLA
jgi:hypothetical protein